MIKFQKFDNEYYRKKHKSLQKKVIIFITEILVGAGSTKTISTLSIKIISASIVISSTAALLTSLALLITNECIRILKTRYTKLRDCIIVITLLFEKTLKTSMVDKKNWWKRIIWFKKRFIMTILIKEKISWKILVLK